MYLIEQMLTGQMKVSDFIILLKSDKSLQEIIRGFVPQEAIGNRSHAFWKEMSYDALLERNFNFLRLVTDLARFDGTIRDNLNIFYNIRCAYLYYKPDLCCTNKYFDAHDRYLAAVGEYYEGPEVTQTLNKIVEDALFITPKSKSIKEIRAKLKEVFHISDKKRPYWIQGGEWPMGKNSPMQYISRSKIPDGVKYIFQDVDTGEIREIEQFY